MNLTLLITIGVPLFIVFAVIYSDRFREPTDLVIKTFVAGIIMCFPAAELNNLIIPSYEYAYRAGLTEEILKFLVLYFYIMPKSAFNEPMDAIVYGTVISLGFATLENIEYVYLMYGDQSFYIAILRAISAIPLHASCGVIMGYYIGLYAFRGSNKYLIQALFIPIVVHSLYNFLTGFGLIFFGYLIGVVYFANTLHKKYVFEQQNKSSEYEQRLK